MGLLAPWFLLALGALGVPLLIHLVRRIRRAPTRFPSLMFLRRFPQREKQRLRLRDPWLLLLRCVALVLLALAFSRPYWASNNSSAATATEGRIVLIALDRSASMQVADYWQQALATTGAIIDGLQPADRAALLTFADRPQLLTRFGADRTALKAALASLAPVDGATAFGPALAQAVRVLQAEPVLPGQTRQIVLISDLQATGLAGLSAPRVPADIEVQLQPIGPTEATKNNIALAGATVTARQDGVQDILTISAQLYNYSPVATSARVALSIAEKPRDVQLLNVPAEGSASITFSGIPAPADFTPAVVALQELEPAQNMLSSDDQLNMTLAPPARLKLLLLTSSDAQNPHNIYLQRAFAVLRQPYVELLSQRLDQLEPATLAGVDAVIINDAPVPGGEAGQALRRYLQAGGGLLVAVGSGSRGDWPGAVETSGTSGPATDDNAWLPGRLGPVAGSTGPLTLLATALTHPLFEQAGDALSSAQIFSYRQVEPTRRDQVLAQLGNGAPVLLERQVGEGRALVLALPLDNSWSDLPLQPGFVLWLKNAVNYLADYQPLPAYYTVGDVIDLSTLSASWQEVAPAPWSVTVRTPAGRALRLSTEQPWLQTEQTGLYRILLDETNVAMAASPTRPLAVASAPAESDLSRLPADAFLARIERPAPVATAAGNTPENQAGLLRQEREQSWWWYLLASLLLLLLVEMFISARQVSSQAPSQARSVPKRATLSGVTPS